MKFLMIFCTIALLTSCNKKNVNIKIYKHGKPVANHKILYSEASLTQIDDAAGKYTAETDSEGKVSIRVDRSNKPIVYCLSIEGENNGEDIARGGFAGGRRVCEWEKDGFDVSFD